MRPTERASSRVMTCHVPFLASRRVLMFFL